MHEKLDTELLVVTVEWRNRSTIQRKPSNTNHRVCIFYLFILRTRFHTRVLKLFLERSRESQRLSARLFFTHFALISSRAAATGTPPTAPPTHWETTGQKSHATGRAPCTTARQNRPQCGVHSVVRATRENGWQVITHDKQGRDRNAGSPDIKSRCSVLSYLFICLRFWCFFDWTILLFSVGSSVLSRHMECKYPLEPISVQALHKYIWIESCSFPRQFCVY